MPVDIIQFPPLSDEVVVNISGRFDFNAREEFAFVAKKIIGLGFPARVRFDFSRADYIDSSAIGFLFKLHSDLGDDYPRMKVYRSNGMVRQIFEAVTIHYLFDVDYVVPEKP